MRHGIPPAFRVLNGLLQPLGARFVEDRAAPVVGDVIDVTVVIPAYNRATMLARAIESVRAQSLRPTEIIVVDDASTDATAEVAADLGARVVRLDVNSGASVARRCGIEAAKTAWVAMLDSDDEWPPWTLSTLWPRRGEHDFVAGATVWMRGDTPLSYEGIPVGDALELHRPNFLVWPQNLVPASGAIARRQALLTALEEIRHYRFSEDFAIWLGLLRRGTGLLVARPTLRYMVHDKQKSASFKRYDDQYAIVRDAYAGMRGGTRLLSMRQAVDAWDRSRAEPATRGVATMTRLLRPPKGMAVLPVLGLRRLQQRRRRSLTQDQDLRAARWPIGD